MATHIKFEEQSIEAEIVELLHDLSADAKMTVMQFVRFMVDQNQHNNSRLPNGSDKTASESEFHYSIKTVSAASGLKLAKSLEGFGYKGDALADSEALYDDLFSTIISYDTDFDQIPWLKRISKPDDLPR